MMKFLIKIESAINFLLIKLGELLLKLVPAPLKALGRKLMMVREFLLQKLKGLPALLKVLVLNSTTALKGLATGIDFKAIFIDSYKKALARYKSGEKNSGKLKTLFLTPFLVVGQWLQGLDAFQSLLLLTFSFASVLAVIGISFSSQRILSKQGARSPASLEGEIEYERPAYYKKDTRHFVLTNLRLPIYFPEVNELRSIDIDFTATTSNRKTRMFLEKKEFHLRDHLILHLEPSIASFPLQDEGKEIIRQKLWRELNDFIVANGVDGKITELKLTYILAN